MTTMKLGTDLPELDAIDRRILAELQQDGRMTNVELARRAEITAPPCLRRVRRLEEAGIIRGYHADTDPARLGWEITFFAIVGLESQKDGVLSAFEAAVAQWPEVRECHMIRGGGDFLLRVVARDTAHENELTQKLTGGVQSAGCRRCRPSGPAAAWRACRCSRGLARAAETGDPVGNRGRNRPHHRGTRPMHHPLARRTLLAAAALAAPLGRVRAQTPAARPKAPLAITVVDVAGNLALTQAAFEAYRKARPEMVSRFTFTKAPAPELPAKIRAQQAANRVDIDLVLTGTDALAAGIDQKIWTALAQAPGVPALEPILQPGALKMQALAQDQGVIVSFCPGGPLLEYMPDRVKTAPGTAAELLDWTRANKNRFMYARPANSGPGRAFLMGLPYILGDANPKDPVRGWDKTWSFLQELDKGIEYYPTGTGPVFKELGEGSRDIVTTITGWDINPRALGIVPKEAKVAMLKGFHFINDAHYICVPKGLDPERTAVLTDLVGFMLGKPAQAFAWDTGYFYPGPAVRDVPLSMAPKESQDVIAEFGRPEYDAMIADTPNETPLEADQMVLAFRRWDEQVGGKKSK